MKKALRVVCLVVLSVAVLAAAGAFAARFQDGPTAFFPGGPLASGEWVEPSWDDASALADVGEIELQLLDPPRSRTTWIVVVDGAAYVPCGVPTFEAFKQWPHEAMRDGRAVVRIDGRRHRRTLVRVTEPALVARLYEAVARKYPVPSGGEPGPDDAWYFRLDPRPAS